MTREDVKKIFPDATDEQITAFLNQSNSDVAKEKAKSQKLKEQAEQANAFKSELEELKKQNLSETEKLELEREEEKKANEKRISDLEKALAESNQKALTSEITSIFANAGMTGDTYASAILAFANMKNEDAIKNAQSFVDGISEINKTALENAKASWEKEVLENTPNPGGAKDDNSKDEESIGAKYAKAYSAKMNPESQSDSENAPTNF